MDPSRHLLPAWRLIAKIFHYLCSLQSIDHFRNVKNLMHKSLLKLILSSGTRIIFLRKNCYDLFWIVYPAVDWLFNKCN